MINFLRAGGPGIFVVLLLSLAGLAAAIQFVRGGSAQRLSRICALSWAIVASSVTGAVAGIGATFRHVAAHPATADSDLLVGVAESLTNAVLGGGMLCLIWTLVAIGTRRTADD
jgi:hypothetical protein